MGASRGGLSWAYHFYWSGVNIKEVMGRKSSILSHFQFSISFNLYIMYIYMGYQNGAYA